MRGYTTPPYMFLLPGYGPRSSNSVRNPPRAASIAAQEPAGPAPTMTTSKSVSATVGDDPGRADARLQSRAKSCELIEALGRVEPSAAGNDAAGFGEIDRGGISLERLFDGCVLSRRHRQRHVANRDIAVDHVDAT